MNKKFILKTCVLMMLPISVCLRGSDLNVFLLDENRLNEVKNGAVEANGRYESELKELFASADRLIERGKLYSVTDTGDLPPSGDVHDYFSLSPYWWPDPSKADGLPYIRRDGETNPERDRVSDRKPVESMIEDVGILGEAYYFSGKEKYAEFAGNLLRTWFLDKATRMNPNLNHGQMVRGRNTGKSGAVIGTRRFCLLVDSVGLIEGSSGWSAQDQAALKGWMSEFLDWLLESEFGKEESQSDNNHGTSYDMQVVSIALYVGRDDVAKKIINESTKERISTQIEPDGAQPKELARTKGWNYCVENIKYLFRLARMAKHVDIDLFHYTPEDGGDLKTVIDFLIPYTTKENNWPYQQITEWQPERFEETLQVAGVVYNTPEIDKALKGIGWEKPTLNAYLNMPSEK